jgi:hypothetical protein
MEDESKDVMDLIWDRTLELFIKIHDCPITPNTSNALFIGSTKILPT